MRKQWLVILVAFILAIELSLLSPSTTWATPEYQTCYQNTPCVVGEFLYSDSYVPIATADCRLTSRYPDAEIFINSATMSASVDGWYSYEVTATGSAGLYRSQICCSDGTDYLCLDKSFEVEATSSSGLTKAEVASAVWDESRASHTQVGSFGEALQNLVPSSSELSAAVWGYSSRTLTSFSSLPSLIWSYSSRSLSSFSSLVASIWDHDDRTVSNSSSSSVDTSNLAKQTDLDSLKDEVLYNQSLLEKLANKPIIKNYLEEEPDVDLETKLNQTQTHLTKIFIDSYAIDSKLGMIDIRWDELDSQELLKTTNEIINLSSTLVNRTKKIKDAWNLPLADNLNLQAQAIANRIAIIKGELVIEDKSTTVLSEIKNLSSSVNSFISVLGSTNDKPNKQTLFSQFKGIKETADKLDLYASSADKLLSSWQKLQLKQIQEKTNRLADNLATINKLPNTISIVSSNSKNSLVKKLKNRLLSIKATIEANKILLAKKTSKPFSNSWLEEGSVIFKTLLTNPSTRISQEVPLKYYLPQEINKENVIDKDDGLTINYDVDKKQLYVEGEFMLGPSESKIVSLRVEDIWLISEASLESLRHQAEELTKPLAKTAFFGQGVTIKSNIDVALDKIIDNQKTAFTPEAKIKNYYEAQIELKAVKAQISKLEDLVTQSGSFGSMAGFVGGSQAIAVWGLIVIMVAGFVFLVIYMRALRVKETVATPIKPALNNKNQAIELTNAQKAVKPGLADVKKKDLAYFATIFFVMNILASSLTVVTINKFVNNNQETKQAKPINTQAKANQQVLGTSMEKADYITIIDLKGYLLSVKTKPDGEMIGYVHSGQRFKYLQTIDDWVEIELEGGKHGYIAQNYVLQEK